MKLLAVNLIQIHTRKKYDTEISHPSSVGLKHLEIGRVRLWKRGVTFKGWG